MRTTVRSVAGSYGLGDRWVKSSITAAFSHAASDRSASIAGASAGSIRTAVMLRRTNGGREFAGTSPCVGGAAAWAAAINVSPLGAEGVVESANAMPQVLASPIATAVALVAHTNLLTRTYAPLLEPVSPP